jgi:hypothetical protein
MNFFLLFMIWPDIILLAEAEIFAIDLHQRIESVQPVEERELSG